MAGRGRSPFAKGGARGRSPAAGRKGAGVLDLESVADVAHAVAVDEVLAAVDLELGAGQAQPPPQDLGEQVAGVDDLVTTDEGIEPPQRKIEADHRRDHDREGWDRAAPVIEAGPLCGLGASHG